MATDLLPQSQQQTPGGLPVDAFEVFRNVPVFKEHRTHARNGRELIFGPEELAAVCRRCNQRIEGTGDYAAVVIGHTPSPEAIENGAAMPEQIGFAGPFRMGKMQDGAAAIFADFWIYKEDAHKLRKFPRRSPELWLEERYEEMFLDPIALLGAETPRLDLGTLLYSAVRDGRQVERYAAAAPGAMNSYVPSEDYAADDQPNTGSPAMALSPDDIRQVVDAIMATDAMQWVKSQMEAGQPGDASATPKANGNGGPPAVPEDGSEEYANTPEGNRAMWAQVDETENGRRKSGSGYAKSRMKGNWHQTYNADGEDVEDEGEPVQYNADGTPKPEELEMPQTGKQEPENYARGGVAIKYAKLEREHRELAEKYAKLEAAVEAERALRVDTQRQAELERLKNDGYMLDVAEEMEVCKYGRMSDADFQRHTTRIVQRYARCPHGADLPEGVLPMRQQQAEKYSKSHIEKAKRLCTQAAERGERLTFEAALEQAAGGAA